MENNRVAISIRVLMYYAKILEISMDELVGITDPIDRHYSQIDDEIFQRVLSLNIDKKRKIAKSIEIWNQ